MTDQVDGQTSGQFPLVPDYHRAHRPLWLRRFSRYLFSRLGWYLRGEVPLDQKMVLVAGPHTSNWDFLYAMLAMLSLDVRLHWLGKKSIFDNPLRKLFLWLGGIPVDRENPRGFAAEVAGRIHGADQIIIAITPEGTRSRVERLKTGFSRIAREVPCAVLPVTIDFRKKEIRLLATMDVTDNPDADAASVRELFTSATPKNPENF